MAVTGRTWCDFVSYSPLFPPEMQLHKTHFTINPDLVKALEREALNFLAELHETVTTLRGRYPNGRDPIHTSATGDGAGR